MASISKRGRRRTIGKRRRGFAMSGIMMFLPIIIGAFAQLIIGMTGFVETAFMDMTLSLEGFDYGFGYDHCQALIECGNSTFDAYVRSRDLAFMLFTIGLLAIAVKDLFSGLGEFGGENLKLDNEIFWYATNFVTGNVAILINCVYIPVHISTTLGRRYWFNE